MDVDIDFLDRNEILSLIKHIPASIRTADSSKKHNTGVYCHAIPTDPLVGTASIDYKIAEQRGYFKIDFLNVSAYQGVQNETHINNLLAVEPPWELLAEKEVTDNLIHINGYHVLLSLTKPSSISELAMVLALIRPGKKHLLEQCVSSGFDSIKNLIWEKPLDNSYYFKKAHAVGYSHLIVMQLNLFIENLSNTTN